MPLVPQAAHTALRVNQAMRLLQAALPVPQVNIAPAPLPALVEVYYTLEAQALQYKALEVG